MDAEVSGTTPPSPALEAMRARRRQALAVRAAHLTGSARALLDSRLESLAADPTTPIAGEGARASDATKPSPLAQLLADLATAGRARGRMGTPAAPAPVQAEAGAGTSLEQARSGGGSDANGFAELPALAGFRSTWARLRTAGQLQDALADVPEDAGPMHSTVLVHRALALMHAQAPGYLQHFLGQLDALAGLERISPVPATTPAPRSPRPPPPSSPASASRPRTGPRPRSRGRRRPG